MAGRERFWFLCKERKTVHSLSSSGERLIIYSASPVHLLHLGSGSLESVFIYCLLEAKLDTKFWEYNDYKTRPPTYKGSNPEERV